MYGPVETRLRRAIERHRPVCLALLDAEDATVTHVTRVVRKCDAAGVTAFLVGGSTVADQLELDRIVRVVKGATDKPVILFPGNVTGVSPRADAIFFSSLLNSDNPYFIAQAQALGALAVRKYGLEALPMGYLVVGEGGAIGFVGRARGLPGSKPGLTAMYALAAQYLGMRFVYLEAGSGVPGPVPSEVVRVVRKVFDGVLLVGGGIREPTVAQGLARAGADILVLGTLFEEPRFADRLRRILAAVSRSS